MRSNKLEVVVGALLIVVIGLTLMVAVLTYMLESGQPAKMFPLVVPELWKAAYGQQHNMTTNITATTNTTSSSNNNSTITPEYFAQLEAEDPSFAAFHDIFDQCSDNALYGNGTISHFQCVESLQEGVDKWCGIENYHKDKCESASLTFTLYVETHELFTNLGIGGSSGGSLQSPMTPPSIPTPSPPPQEQQLTPEQQQEQIDQEREQLKQQDPEFARFDQMAVSDCAGTIGPISAGLQPLEGSPSLSLCQQELDRALSRWCDPINAPTTYHADKCEYVDMIQELWADVLR